MSDLGRIKRVDNDKSKTPDGIVKPKKHRCGYRAICLRQKPRIQYWLIHRLVMLAFVGAKIPKMEVNHKNGIKHDNRLTNLEYVTSSENKIHRAEVLRSGIGEENPHSRLTDKDVLEIRFRSAMGELGMALAEEYGVSRSQISRIVNGKQHKYLRGNPAAETWLEEFPAVNS